VIAALIPTVQRPEITRRLTVGLVFSILVHAGAIWSVRPMTVDFVQARPLQVEILASAPSAEPATVVSSDSDIAVPTGSARNPASAEEQRAPANTSAARVSGPDLGLAPERYYNSREVDVRAEPLNPAPLIYPRLAYQNRVKGVVLLKVLINERGAIDDVLVVESEPRGTFEAAALNATLATRFSPAIRNGRAVKTQKILEIMFDPYESIHIP
jgi:TonB family protein